jgi:predicted nucleotidyltransferase component of viral defense system
MNLINRSVVTVELTEIRVIALTAIAADDWLMEHLVLKGGCALELVHHIGGRSSLDIDFSIEGDFADPSQVAQRLQAALAKRFATMGYVVFDFSFREKPEGSAHRTWGGYLAEFKLIERARHLRLAEVQDGSRRQALVTGPNQKRIFRIELSKHEHCTDKQLVTVRDYDLYVYSPAMIAAEKIRAICQQSVRYSLRRHPAPRPRDFYDIYSIITHTHLELANHADLVRTMFETKAVPLALIGEIPESRGFHEAAWSSVRDAVAEKLQDFDFYFDFVVERTLLLHSLWDV